jgi:hypothetical protein
MASRSVRIDCATYVKEGEINEGVENTDVEDIAAYEFRYERQHTKHLWFAGGMFFNKLDVVEWDGSFSATGNIGTEKVWGFEGELSYRKDRLRVDVSHSFTKLYDLRLIDGVTHDKISVTSDVFEGGYGHDLQNWFNHSSDIRLWYKINDKLDFDSSLNIYWNNPGGKDTVDYIYYGRGGNREKWVDTSNYSMFGPQFYLNLGFEYKHNKNLLVRFDAFNVLGWLDDDANLRRIGVNTFRASSAWRVSPSLAIQIKYKF